MEFGRKLKDARIRLGLSLAEIEEETKIRKYYLEALEAENFAVLPPPVYASGFVKRYASILGLDEQEVVAEFRELAYGKAPESHFLENEEPIERPSRKPWPVKNIAAGLIFLVAALWLGSYVAAYITNRGQEKIAEPAKPQIQEQTQEAPAVQPGTQPPTSTENQTTASAAGVNVDLEALARCWIRVTVDGKLAFTGTLVTGDRKSFAGTKSVIVESGNNHIKIMVNGQEQAPLQGSKPQVMEYKAPQ